MSKFNILSISFSLCSLIIAIIAFFYSYERTETLDFPHFNFVADGTDQHYDLSIVNYSQSGIILKRACIHKPNGELVDLLPANKDSVDVVLKGIVSNYIPVLEETKRVLNTGGEHVVSIFLI